MSDERRYLDGEIAEIFEAAAAPRRSAGRALSASEGLTLAELQEIGREVGVEPERIAEAASALDLRGAALARRTHLGMPISVGRIVELPRAPTDHEWELLVAELRETFSAQGRDRSQGNLRQWTNGNLRANVEPTETGYRLRLGTRKSDAMALNWLGIAWLLMTLAMLAVMLLTGEAVDDLFEAILFAAIGPAALVFNTIRLPRWALEREEQMEHIAARARALITPAPGPAGIGRGDG